MGVSNGPHDALMQKSWGQPGPYTCVICRLSWLPRRMVIRSR